MTALLELNAMETAPTLERYELRGRLGEGAVGVVWEAFDRATGTRVALKTLRDASADRLRTLKNEFRVVQDLHHPNIVHPLELFEEAGCWYLTMEFVAGPDFLAYVRGATPGRRTTDPPPRARASAGGGNDLELARASEAPPFQELRLRAALAQVASGLATLHQASKLHLDIKPANVLVTAGGRVVLVDFGVARDVRVAHSSVGDRLRGTANYMAPEQALGEEAGPAADWYAVGVMLFAALTGRLPFVGSGMQVLSDKVTTPPPRASAIARDVPADLDELSDLLLRIDPAARPTTDEILRRLDVRLDAGTSGVQRLGPTFFGRRGELAELARAYEDTRARGAVAVLVEGASGVGKSRLVRRFIEQVASMADAPLVLAGRCYERESTPYKGVDAAFDELAAFLSNLSDDELDALRPARSDLLGLAFPVLAEALRVAPTSTRVANLADVRARVFTTVRALLQRLARDRAVIIALDDLQWADADSRALLGELLRPPDPPRVLFLATRRDSTNGEAEAAALGGDVRRLRVGELPAADARLLVASLLEGQRVVGPTDVGAIVAEAKGHPLFLEEIARERGANQGRGNVLRLDDAVRARVERLEGAPRRLLEAVCVAGLPTPVDVVARAAGVPTIEVFRHAATLRSAHLVASSAVRLDDRLAPYHDRVREAVASGLDAASRRAWHARLAASLEGHPSADPEALAAHWQGAGDTEKAGVYALRAAERGAAALAFDRAAHFYAMAVELHSGEVAARDVLRLALADALANAGRGAEAAAIRLDLAPRQPATIALDLRRRAAEELLVAGRTERGAEVLYEALADAHVWAPRSPIAIIFGLLIVRVILRLRSFRFEERDPRDIDAAQLVRIDTAFSAGAGFAMTDNVRGAYFLARSLRLALAAGDRNRVTIALAYEACYSSVQGTRSQAHTDALVAETTRLAERGATPRARALSIVAPAYRDYFLGNWRSAAALLTRAERFLADECVGAQLELNPTRILLFRALGYLGDIEQLTRRVPAALREAQRLGDVNMQRNLESGPMPLLALVADDPAAAEALIAAASHKLGRERFHLQHYMCVISGVQVDLYRGRGRDAEARLRYAWPALRRSLLLRVQAVRAFAYEHRARASVAASLEASAANAPALLARAERDARALTEEGPLWCAALGQLVHATIAGARGDTTRALVELRAAAAALRASDLLLHAGAAEHRLAALDPRVVGTAVAVTGVDAPDRLAACLVPWRGLNPDR